MGRDHSCEVCGRGGFNDDGECECGPPFQPEPMADHGSEVAAAIDDLRKWADIDVIRRAVGVMTNMQERDLADRKSGHKTAGSEGYAVPSTGVGSDASDVTQAAPGLARVPFQPEDPRVFSTPPRRQWREIAFLRHPDNQCPTCKDRRIVSQPVEGDPDASVSDWRPCPDCGGEHGDR